MQVQTRASDGELLHFSTIRQAMKYAEENHNVWKISFNAEDGTRVRLTRMGIGWIYDSIEDRLAEMLKEK